ncbi:type II secretion system protein [Rubellicoccus peritrichatus]|uniref:Type II secretion system protein n=1 Tax=Rubellicoccus peritrichatus TaxID=3080537 RepID=A0AAQ3LDP8_9BACT|nr:type II secretion system protein [Puniceicoccus sp. CR14]WOO43586.1 type II secretion system protein [Puniceicoccus sp. CR14]
MKPGFTLIELLAVIAIVGILASILVVVTGQVKQSAAKMDALNSMRNIGVATQLYVNDNDGFLPGPAFGLQTPRYRSDSSNLSRHLWAYLDASEPTSELIEIDGVVDRYRQNVGHTTAWIRCDSNVLMQNGKRLDPFGYPGASPETDPKRAEVQKLMNIYNPAKEMMLEDADQTNTWSGAGWYGTLPEQPMYDSRLRLFFDGHVEAVNI